MRRKDGPRSLLGGNMNTVIPVDLVKEPSLFGLVRYHYSMMSK